MREDYEKKEKEKIRALEEEEQRKDRVKELQKRRRDRRRNKGNTPQEETPGSGNTPASSRKRNLPAYYNNALPNRTALEPGRGRRQRENISPNNRMTTRSGRKNLVKEEEKEIANRRRPRDRKGDDKNLESEEVSPELLEQIYSESPQDDKGQLKKDLLPPAAVSAAERLVDDDSGSSFRGNPHRKHANPLGMAASMPPRETDDEMIQRAIAESLKEQNTENIGMRKLDPFLTHPITFIEDGFGGGMDDPEMMEAIKRSMQDS